MRVAPTSGSPSVTSRTCTAFSEHNYTSGSFQSVADMAPFSVAQICNYAFKRLLYVELDLWILWYGCRHLISHILCYVYLDLKTIKLTEKFMGSSYFLQKISAFSRKPKLSIFHVPDVNITRQFFAFLHFQPKF